MQAAYSLPLGIASEGEALSDMASTLALKLAESDRPFRSALTARLQETAHAAAEGQARFNALVVAPLIALKEKPLVLVLVLDGLDGLMRHHFKGLGTVMARCAFGMRARVRTCCVRGLPARCHHCHLCLCLCVCV